MITSGETLLWSWLHLSDIHLEHGDRAYKADQKLVLSRLIPDIRDKAIPASVSPKALLVTGDIAYSGGLLNAEEYARAEELLSKIRGVLDEDVTVHTVPGNHDVQRVKDESSDVGKLLTHLRDRSTAIDTSLEDSHLRSLLSDRFANYSRFAERAKSAHADPISWTQRIQAGQHRDILVIGVNTALLSNDDDDERRLGIERAPIDDALSEAAENSDLVIMLSHHPLSWLAAEDEKYLTDRVNSFCDVHLHGHVHEASNSLTKFAYRDLGHVHIVAGALHGDDPSREAHRYSIAALVELPDQSIWVRFHSRKWLDAGGWCVDGDLHKEGKTYGELRVREPRTAPSSQRTSTRRQPVGGVALRSSSTAEWLIPVCSVEGPELCVAADADSRPRALMSPAGTLFAQQEGQLLQVASLDDLGTSTAPWPSTFHLKAGRTAIAIAEAGAHDAVVVLSTAEATYLAPLDRDEAAVGPEVLVASVPGRFAVVEKGRVLLAVLKDDRTLCQVFTGLADVQHLDAVSLGGSTLVQAAGLDHGGQPTAFHLLLSSEWNGYALLRKRPSQNTIGLDLKARRPVVVGVNATPFRRFARDTKLAPYRKWIQP